MGLTPMMQQYLTIHEEVPDAILMFRLGDFYEMFFDDAKNAAKVLELALTGRDCGLEERAPMCGVPFHAAESYIAKLVENGYKVAICEQMEDPALAKGLVKREIIKILSPGTLTDAGVLDPQDNNFMMSVYAGKGTKKGTPFGAAMMDLSTGDFYATEKVSTDLDADLMDLIARYQPSEILLHTALYDENRVGNLKRLTTGVVEPYPSENFQKARCEAALKDQFHVYTLASLGLSEHGEAVRACGALLNYAREMQKTSLDHIRRVDLIQERDTMNLDAASRQNLELTRTIRSSKKAGSLLSVLDKTKTNAGSRMLKSFIEAPLVSKEKIDARLERVQELYDDPVGLEEIRESISRMYDLERINAKIMTGSANPVDLISLRESAAALNELAGILGTLEMPSLREDIASLDRLEDLRDLIERAIHEPSGEGKRFSAEPKIRRGFDPELDELRDLSENGKDYLMQIEADEREKTGISTLKVKYNKVFGYFIEVSKGKIDMVPERFIRKQTLANSERYFTEELKETENKIIEAEGKLEVVEARLYNDVVATIRDNAQRIQSAARIAAEIDVYAALARQAIDAGYVRPEITTDGSLEIIGGRHPVVEAMTGRANFISNDTKLDEADRMMLITGPNMAGKSTYIRQTALIVLMAQIGSFVPADSAKIGLVDRIFTRVGASDDLGTGQSTFMVEMTEVSNILRNATKRSLVILDEIGRGTSTFDGISIAWAICEDLLERGIKTLFATHYHELTELEGLRDGIVNYSIAVKESRNGVVFLRKIRRGAADQSYGIEVAKLAGFPERVTDRAKEILLQLEKNQNIDLAGTIPVSEAPGPVSSQISFFYPQSTPESRESKALERLRELDPDGMSPRQAQDALYELIDLLEEED